MTDERVQAAPEPLLGATAPSGGRAGGEVVQARGASNDPGLGHRLTKQASRCVLWLLLLMASGAPLLLLTVLQELGRLPDGRRFYQLLYPLGGGSAFAPGPDGKIDLMAPNYLSLSFLWFGLCIAWEAVVILAVLKPEERPKHVPRINDAISSLSLGILYVLIARVVSIQWGRYVYTAIYDNLRVTDAFSDPNNVWGWWLCLLLTDVMYYAYHRTSHWISWVWAEHVVHHSSEEYNLSTALRQPSNSLLTPSVLFSTATSSFFFPPELAVQHAQFSLLYQFWIHTQLIPPLPRVELVFNTPSLHRLHHARNVWALGKNYGAIFSIWDHLGGTFLSELSNDEQIYYGVIPPLNSWNPIWANMAHWYHMFVVQWRWHGWKTPFVHWTPPGSRCPRLGARLNPLSKFDAFPAPWPLRAYVLLQFLEILGITGYFVLGHPPTDLLAPAVGSAAADIVNAVAVVAVALAAASLAQLESAAPPRLRGALLLNGLLHLLLAGLAEAALLLDAAQRERAMWAGAEVGHALVAAYLLLHAALLTGLWMMAADSAVCVSAAAQC